MRRSGVGSCLLVLLLTACPYGFAGGGLPSHVRSIAVVPFENETPSAELPQELHVELRREIVGRLGLRDASESRANAIVRGTILRYDTDVPIGYSADPTRVNTARRQLQIAVDIEMVDQTTGRTLWQRKGLTATAEYAERAEAEGRRRAIEQLVNDIIQGAQSQW